MKAHIRKVPTKETYFKKLGETIDKLKDLGGGTAIPKEVIDRLSSRMQTDEYYEKMKEALIHGTGEDNEEQIHNGDDGDNPSDSDIDNRS